VVPKASSYTLVHSILQNRRKVGGNINASEEKV
jgi:hypothetical protein